MKKMLVTGFLMASALLATAHDSPLASGRWWSVRVEATGVFRLTASDVPALVGSQFARIALFGDVGTQLSVQNAAVSTEGLRQLPVEPVDRNGNGLFDADDALLFYAEGTDNWRYDAELSLWTMQRHSYATANCYFLTLDAVSPSVILQGPQSVVGDTVAQYTAVDYVNHDLVNIMQTGQYWLGERMTTSMPTRSFTLRLPRVPSGNAVLRYALASKSNSAAEFRVSAGSYNGSHHLLASSVYGSYVAGLSLGTQSLDVGVTYMPAEGSAVGYVDFVELTAPVPMTYGGGQQPMRTVASSPRHYSLGGASSSLSVWEVGDPVSPRRMALGSQSGRLVWGDSVARAAVYVAFAESDALAPASVAPLANQNLLGAAQADYVVVTVPDFMEQAGRIAAIHELFDTLTTIVVTDREVYNEFSSGKQDPLAIRTFLRSMAENHPQRPPRYLLLMGKATYDPRNIEGRDLPQLVTFESPFSFDDDGGSYSSDDMMAFLGPSESGSMSEAPDVAVGRLPVRNAAEAAWMVQKIERYMTDADLSEDGSRGDWRNVVALLADDADPSKPYDTSFVNSSERSARDILARYPMMNVDRLYADSYQQQSGAIGSYYPDLNNALRQRIDYGCLILNYVGHGSTGYIGTERYIEQSDIANFTNYGRWPVLMASTCSYGRQDLTEGECGAETMLKAQGGAIGVISASRPISHNHFFDRDVLLFLLDRDNRVGDAVRLAKARNRVPLCVGLLGDPALRLSIPENDVVVTSVNGHACGDTPDSARVLSSVTVAGEVRDPEGRLVEDFDGMLFATVYDRVVTASTLGNDNPGTEVRFEQQKSVLFRGSVAVQGGRWEYTFTVPRDVAYRYDRAKLSHYARSGQQQARGAYLNLVLGGLDEEAGTDASRPQVCLFMGDTLFRDGGVTSSSPTLLARLFDSVGINAVGSGIGHDITAIIDGQPGSLIVLNDFYEPDLGDSRSGSVRYRLSGLAPGRHTLQLKAWNIFNLSSTAELSFVVAESDEAVFQHVSVVPNPARDRAVFTVEVSDGSKVADARFALYSSRGQLLLEATPQWDNGSFVVGPVVWDCAQAAPGLYLGRFSITTSDGEIHHQTVKCVVR